MKDSSANSPSVFSGLHLKQISTLVGLLTEIDLRSSDHVAKRYKDSATDFKATVQFLTEIGILQSDGGELLLSRLFDCSSASVGVSLEHWLVEALISKDNIYRSEFSDYLKCFSITDGTATYQPHPQERGTWKDVRNFMMELGMVLYDETAERYILSNIGIEMFAKAVCGFSSISQEEFAYSQRQKEAFGLSAELAVLEYERKRVGRRLADRVVHVAETNIAAGYDISSITVRESDTIPRYIEVKAVPLSSYRFYWSANEYNVARKLASLYYIYLVPADKCGVLDTCNIRLIADPCRSLFEQPDDWYVEEGLIRCSLKGAKNDYCCEDIKHDDR